ncbi:MAG: ABC transporter permease [Methylobacteriaceae bacterium]|nr:ABC transporter permease [Methylobacteriaceae bacterium]
MQIDLRELGARLKETARVISVLMIRDVRTRYGGIRGNYIVAIGWPLCHLLALVGTFIFVNRMLPFGSDSVLYIASGALPYILCVYPARQTGMSFIQNMGVLNLPIVRPIHLILSRALLEALTACTVCIVFMVLLRLLGEEIVPEQPSVALCAIYASVFFGISMGVTMSIASKILNMPGYFAFIGIMVLLYVSAGVAVPMNHINETVDYLRSFNPIYHLVQWMRSAYYDDTHAFIPLDKFYVVSLAGGLLAFGLLGERLFRGRMLK